MEWLKKNYPYLLVVLFISWSTYRFFDMKAKTARPEEKMSQGLDWAELDRKEAQRHQDPATLQKEKSGERRVVTKEHSELSKLDEDNFKDFDEMEEKWLKKVQTIFTAPEYAQYLDMRKRNEQEKMVAYKEYHDHLRETQGDAFSYKISEDQSVREKSINQDYLKELLGLIGEEKFKTFVSERDKMNEALGKEGKEFIQVEF